MQNKKPIIIIAVLSVMALGLGYWVGLPNKRAEVGAPPGPVNVVTNGPLPPFDTEVKTNKGGTNNLRPPDLPSVIELEIRILTGKPTGELTEADFGKVSVLHLSGAEITDTEMKKVAKLQKLFSLNLVSSQITDTGLKEVAKLKQLKQLTLWNAKITDAGLKELAGMTQLTTLGLGDTQITDAGLKELAKLKQLTYLNLRSTKTTQAGVGQLQKALPNCEIHGP